MTEEKKQVDKKFQVGKKALKKLKNVLHPYLKNIYMMTNYIHFGIPLDFQPFILGLQFYSIEPSYLGQNQDGLSSSGVSRLVQFDISFPV